MPAGLRRMRRTPERASQERFLLSGRGLGGATGRTLVGVTVLPGTTPGTLISVGYYPGQGVVLYF